MRFHVLGGNRLIENLFIEQGYEYTDNPYEIDIAIFKGGADVSPSLYGEKNLYAHVEPYRDLREVGWYTHFKNNNIPMVGICRGAQFLHVMNGGSLWQDVDKHAIGGYHLMSDVDTGATYHVTSTHHQMMRLGDLGETGGLIAVSEPLTTYKASDNPPLVGSIEWDTEVEVVYHKDSNCLCFQGHPEYDCPKETIDYFFNLIEERLFV